MKKILAIILALLMLLSFASMIACGEKKVEKEEQQVENNTEKTEEVEDVETEEEKMERLENSKPNEYVPEKLEAGMEVHVAYSTGDLSGAGAQVDAGLTAAMEELGIEYTLALHNGDVALQLEHIENFVTLGVAAIVIAPADTTTVADVCAKAEEAGTSTIIYGALPEYPTSGATYYDLDAFGYYTALIVRKWADEHYPDAEPGSIKVATHGFYIVSEPGLISDAVRRGLEEDERFEIVYQNNNVSNIDQGYTMAEEAFLVDPEVKVIAGWNLAGSLGAANYIASMPDVNLEDYCVVASISAVDIDAMLQATRDGESCLRGVVTSLHDDSSYTIVECIKGLLLEGKEKPYYVTDDIKALTAFEWPDFAEYVEANYNPPS